MSKNKNPKPQYPFLSKKSILDRLATDSAYVLTCLQIIDARQTADESEVLKTKYTNSAGWMSSHAVNGGKLAKKAREEGLSSEELESARAIVSRYGKQLAAHFRAEAIAANPELAEIAKVFSAA